MAKRHGQGYREGNITLKGVASGPCADYMRSHARNRPSGGTTTWSTDG